MKLIGFIVLVILLLSAIAKDRASFRALEILMTSKQMNLENIRLKSIIPGYATWKLSKIRREMDEQYKAENNPKRG
jgi:hypothetical protein